MYLTQLSSPHLPCIHRCNCLALFFHFLVPWLDDSFHLYLHHFDHLSSLYSKLERETLFMVNTATTS